jgi:hypothetical protein
MIYPAVADALGHAFKEQALGLALAHEDASA